MQVSNMIKILGMPFLAALLIDAGASYADLVHLKNGRVLEGEVTEQTDSYLEIKLKVAKAKFPNGEIESVEKKELPEGFFGTEEEKVKPAVSQKKSARGKKTAQAEGYSEPEKLIYSISMKASYEKENKKDKQEEKIYAKADTNLPEGESVKVNLKRKNFVIESKYVNVKYGGFFATFGPFDKSLMPGIYTVEAEFPPGAEKREGWAVREVGVGSDKDIKAWEERAKSEMTQAIMELQGLSLSLYNNYQLNKERFDKKKWYDWSENWHSQLEVLQRTFNGFSKGYVVYLYPEAQQNILISAQNLKRLYDAYATEVEDSIRVSKQIVDIKEHAEKVNSLIHAYGRSFSSAQKDISSDTLAKWAKPGF